MNDNDLPVISYSFGDGTPLVDLCRLTPADITIERIARGLGNICRYGGQVSTFYSVAEHSVLVASLVPQEHRVAAILHDASEALGLGDTIRPLKSHLPLYQRIEAAVMSVIEEWAGLEPGACSHPIIKAADRAVYLAEQQTLRQIDLATLPESKRRGAEPASVQFWCHPPHTAGNHWWSAFNDAALGPMFAADMARRAGGAT